MAVLKCLMCCFSTHCEDILKKHLLRYHRNEANFLMKCSKCPYTLSYDAYRKHLSRCKEVSPNPVYQYSSIVNDDIEETVSDKSCSFEFKVAMFLLRLERNGLSQHCVNVIAEELDMLIVELKGEIVKKVENKLYENNETPPDFSNLLHGENVAKKFNSAEKRKNYYVREFSLVVPAPLFMNSEFRRINGRITRVANYAHHVSFFQSLQALLIMPEVGYWVLNPHLSSDDYLKDWCDGEFVKQRNYLGNYLLFTLHIDDIETVNPIGMHRKIHKLTVISYELVNIPPQFRSSLQVKQLLAICKASYVKKTGLKNLLRDFISGMNILADGYVFEIAGANHLVKGALVGTLADTPAANQLWGFKEGVSKAHKICRTCDGSRPDVFEKFYEEDFSRRSMEEHLERCDLLRESTDKKTIELVSRMYGINNQSPLFDILNVDLQLAVHDPMHILLEGIVILEMKIMIFDFLFVQKFFNLQWLNEELRLWDYHYLHKSTKLPTFDSKMFKDGGKLPLSAAAVLLAIAVLPFVLIKKVPNHNVKLLNFIRLIKITHICTSPYASRDIDELSTLINQHHNVFSQEYPSVALTPKFHYLIHFPQQLKLFGPLRHHWCMRWEAHFSIFKGRKWGSFKNIALSMAFYHQIQMCYSQLGGTGERNSNYLYKGHKVITDQKREINYFPEGIQDDLASTFGGNEIWTAKDVIYHSCHYKPGAVLAADDSEKAYFILSDIIVSNFDIFFVAYFTKNCIYVNHLNAFQIEFSSDPLLFNVNSLKRPFPLPLIDADKQYVINPNVCHVHV